VDASWIATLATAWLGYRWGLRQDERQWSRSRRADLYADLLAEVGAEQDWLYWRFAQAIENTRPRPDQFTFNDLRLGPVERARLGVRAATIASEEVGLKWNAFNRVASDAAIDIRFSRLGRDDPMSASQKLHPLIADAARTLTRQIRMELRADQLRFGEGTRWLGWAYRLGKGSSG
jgi:hypothetical protein